MENTYSKIQELLHQKADFQARLNLLPYDGTPEVKDRDGQKYLYIRKRVGSRLTSTYVDVYSEDLCATTAKRANYGNKFDISKKIWLRWDMRKPTCHRA